MERGAVKFGIFTLILLVFLSFGVFAAPPSPGTCAIVIPNECVAAAGNYRIMGLSSITNAHAESPYSGYPYVLCCRFNTTEGTACTGSNKLLGLSSITNAHAEAPSQTNYLTNVCYGDLQCRNSTSNCGATGSDVETYKLNLTSLSSVTNAHVGAIGDFPVKICCKSSKYLSSCTINSASWNQIEANSGVQVYLTVTGSGSECDGQRLDIEVIGATKSNATSVSFRGDTALSWWTAEWQSSGIFGGDKSYSFNASIVGVLGGAGKSMKSSNELTVEQINTIDHCSTIASCDEYTDSNECDTDSPCNVANSEGISQGVACDGIKTYCSCSWNAGICEFRWSEIQSGLCETGYTLCYSPTSKVDYCYPAASCPSGDEPITDSDSVCETGEGCSADCDGEQDGCVSGAICQSGMCFGTTPPTNADINCSYGFTLCQVLGTNYCYPGNICPTGQIPPSNSNGKCDFGEGCTSTECKDGDRDSCISGTYCLLGKCAAIQDPITVGSVGGCKIIQTIEKDCDEEPVGYKIISWTGTWTGIGDDASNPAYQRCIAGGRTTIPCPAQIQLSFFNYYNLIIAIGVIALVYISLNLRKKSKRKKK